MKKYMLIYNIPQEDMIPDENRELPEEQEVRFYDDYTRAHNAWMDITCSVGAYAELYARMKSDPDMDDAFADYTYIQIE